MLSENLPKCICGKHNYSGGGGYCGPDLAYTNFKCDFCGRYVMELHPWVFFSSESKDDTILTNYINKVILPLHRQMQEDKNLDHYPPQIPKGVDIYERAERDSEREWILLDRFHSQDSPLPIDPIAVHHQELWKETVEKTGAKEIPNQYYNDHLNNQPWYEFDEHGATIQFGPRKRVLVIRVNHSTHFNVMDIAKKAEEDSVTYTADRTWKSKKGTCILVRRS